MKNIRLSLLFVFLGTVFVQPSFGQLIRTAAKSNLSDSVNLILAGFGNNFWSIQGNAIDAQSDPATYQSRYTLPGSRGAVITRYSSVEDSSASWQAVVFESEEFQTAAKAYRKWIQDLKSVRIRFLTGQARFTGDVEKPDENLRFTTTGLVFLTSDLQYRQLHAEVSLLSDLAGWQVQVSFYRRKIQEAQSD